MKAVSKENMLIPSMRQQLAETEKEICNLLNVIQQGLLNTSAAKKRLDDLEAQKEELELGLSQAKFAYTKDTKDEIVNWICQYKFDDVNSIGYRRKIIDAFVNAIRVYEYSFWQGIFF